MDDIINYTSNCCESKYYTPGQFCNNFKNIKENHDIFKRNFPSKDLDITFFPRPINVKCCLYNDKTKNEFKSSCNYKCNNNLFNYINNDCYKDNKNKDNHSKFNPGEGTYSGFLKNIDNDSNLIGLNNKSKKQDILPLYSKKAQINNIDFSDRSYPQIGITNSYSCENLPSGIDNCSRNFCLNTKPMMPCKDEKLFNIVQSKRKDWKEYSKIHNMTDNMIKDIRFYTDNNTYPFVLNHVSVGIPKKCYDQRCEQLFNNNTSANSIDGRYTYEKLLK